MQSAQQQLEAVLSGAAPYDSLSDALKSAIRIHVYFRASAVLDLPDNKAMKEAIEREPVDLQPLIRRECRRLWNNHHP